MLAGQVSHRRGSRLRYMAGWHSGTQLSPTRLPGKAERMFAPEATGSGDTTQPVPVSAAPSTPQQPQPPAQEALESQPALQEKLKSCLDQKDGCKFLN